MEKRKFYTLIKADHKLSQNAYVRGRISGVMQVLCMGEPGKGFAIMVFEESNVYIFTALCTEDDYMVFRNYVEVMYPGLCEFDYKFEK